MKKYLRKTLEYTAGNLFNKLLLLLLLPIFTHLMVPEEFAIYANLMIFISFASLIYFLGLQQSLFSYFHHERTNEYKYSLISSIYITIVTIGIILSLLIICFRSQLSLLIVRTELYENLFVWISLILLFDLICGMTLSILNIMEKSANYVLLSIVRNVLFLILVIRSIITKQFSINNLFIYLTISSICSALISSLNIFKILNDLSLEKLKKKIFSFSIIKSPLKFGIIMIPGTIAMIILRVFDRYMLTYLSANSLYDVGIYAVGYRIGMIMQFLVSMVSLVYLPYAMRIADKSNAKESYKNIFKYFVIFGGILGTVVIFFSSEIFYLFIDKAYSEGIKIVFFSVISNFLLGVFNIINISFYIKKKAGNITLAVGIGALLNIFLNFILIPIYGIYGAGIASVIAYFFIVIFNYFAAKRVYFIDYNFAYVIAILVFMVFFSMLNFILKTNTFISLIKVTLIITSLSVFIYSFRRNDKFKKFLNIIFIDMNNQENSS